MPKLPLVFLRRACLLLSGVALLSPACNAAGISATASYTDTLVSPGVWNYNLTLNNTGTTNIGTFWFGWVPGAGFLSSAPTNVGLPAGWTDTVTNAGGAVRWVTSTNFLGAGQSLSGFSFTSAESPSALLLNYTGTGVGAGDPVTTSFVYIGAPLADPGFQFAATPAAATVTPEPGSVLLTLTGLGLIAFLMRARLSGLRTA